MKTLRELHVAQGRLLDKLHNAAAPINRLPAEILVHIFSNLLQERRIDSTHDFADRWSFLAFDPRPIRPVLEVCQHWRQLALSTPTLWAHANNGNINDRYLSLSRNAPLTVSLTWLRFTPEMCRSCIQAGSRITVLHIHIPEASIRYPHSLRKDTLSRLSRFLAEFPADSLRHCSIAFPSAASEIMDTVLFRGGGQSLRSLHLSGMRFLPQIAFPKLNRLFIDRPTRSQRGDTNLASWTIGDLVTFLAGCPDVQELVLAPVDMHLVDTGPSAKTQPRSVTLPRLRYFAVGIHEEAFINEAAELLTASILFPTQCHLLFTRLPAGIRPHDFQEPLGGFLAVLPISTPFNRLRIWSTDDGQRIQFGSSSSGGTLTICFGPYDWGHLRAAFKTMPAHLTYIEELWIGLAKFDYNPHISNLRCMLDLFPNLRRLVIGQPAPPLPPNPLHMFDPCFLEAAVGMLRPDDFRFMEVDSGLACPHLDTICIDLPEYTQGMRVLAHVLEGRRQAGYPVRRLVVGYDSKLELDVLGQALVPLQELVEELVCEELRPHTRPKSVFSDCLWLLSNSHVFQSTGMDLYWPDWSEGGHLYASIVRIGTQS